MFDGSSLEGVSGLPAKAGTGELFGSFPAVERFASHYGRYNSPIGRKGKNKTTHTAEVRFSGGDGLAVVKAFSFWNKGWLNEAIAWALGSVLGVDGPPKAMLLVASASELASVKDAEIKIALDEFGGSDPIMFWCASKLEFDSPQQVWGHDWEAVLLKGEAGQRLAAFDAWTGNCDRIADNALYWVSRGRVAAIDHEKMVFAQDWLTSAPRHKDRIKKGRHESYLLEGLHGAIKSNKISYEEGVKVIAALQVFSEEHSTKFESLKGAIEAMVGSNFGPAASVNIISFLTERATDGFIRQRLGLV